jgi:hypothetical protein
MNARKIILLALLAIALVATFVNFSYAALILALLGIPVGLMVPGDAHVRVLVSAIAVNALGHAFDTIPGAGPYIGTFIGNVGIALAGVALAIVFKNLYARLTE